MKDHKIHKCRSPFHQIRVLTTLGMIFEQRPRERLHTRHINKESIYGRLNENGRGLEAIHMADVHQRTQIWLNTGHQHLSISRSTADFLIMVSICLNIVHS